MLNTIGDIGRDWLVEQVRGLTEEIETLTPVEYNERTRYLPASVTSKPGFIRYDVNPFMREILECADINSPIREINLMKGVQITYSTLLESVILYYADYIGTLPMMYMTADKELAHARIENNFIPMFQQSDLGHIIRSSDISSTQKTGKTKDHIQFAKGAYIVPFGAKNADKMRSFSIAIMAKDEIDAWPETVGKDGDPDALSDDRTDGYADMYKIFRGSTPLIKDTSKIYANFLRGDQRKWHVPCKNCNGYQFLKWERVDKATGEVSGFAWDYEEDGRLILDSVRYICMHCGHPHYEYDKTAMLRDGEWRPTAKPMADTIRSYQLPAFNSPVGMRPWSKNVLLYLDAVDPKTKQILDVGKYQVFYNNVLAEPFEVRGQKIRFESVSGHRVMGYKMGEVPNKFAMEHCGSRILWLSMQVDVHKSNLAVAVMGWTENQRCFVIDYWRFERAGNDEDCSELEHPVWEKVRSLIDEKVYVGDDGYEYRIADTWIDAGYANANVSTFCGDYAGGVYPVLGRDRPGKNQRIKEFDPFTSQAGQQGYKIIVDHYKDRLAPVLRREWNPEQMLQSKFHFNAPVDITTAQLTELTKEERRKKRDPNTGATVHYWHRMGENALWDLFIYGHAGTEIRAYRICIEHFKLKTIDWPQFWEYAQAPENNEIFGRVAPKVS